MFMVNFDLSVLNQRIKFWAFYLFNVQPKMYLFYVKKKGEKRKKESDLDKVDLIHVCINENILGL